MHDAPIVIDEPPRGPAGRLSAWLRGRRIFLAASLALVEIVTYLIWRPNGALAAAAAVLLLVLAVIGLRRARPGLWRDILLIVAISQGIVVVLPLAIGLSVFAGVILAIVAVVLLVVLAFRLRF
jgi:hypothetical protein